MGRAVLPLAVLLVVLAAGAPSAAEDDPRYPFTAETLPAGWKIVRGVVMSRVQLRGFSKKLGGEIVSLTNQDLSVNGFAVRVNAITAASGEDASKIEASMQAIRGADFVARRGDRVYEVASQGVLVARRVFAALGVDDHAEASWRVTFRIALVKELDYTAANRVFNHFLVLENDPENASARAGVAAETQDWTFGKSLRLLDGDGDGASARWSFAPAPSSARRAGGTTVFTFDDPPKQEGVPYVDVTGTVRVPARFAPDAGEPAEGLTAQTPFWPVENDRVATTVRAATGGVSEPREKVLRLLADVTRSVRYGGAVGSRDGVLQVLERGVGRCWDKSDVLVTYCRAAGIPARQVAGWVPPLGAGHVWVEVHVDGGWLPVDVTTTWLGTSPEYVPFFRTEDGRMPVVYLKMPVLERVDDE